MKHFVPSATFASAAAHVLVLPSQKSATSQVPVDGLRVQSVGGWGNIQYLVYAEYLVALSCKEGFLRAVHMCRVTRYTLCTAAVKQVACWPVALYVTAYALGWKPTML